MLTTTNQTRDTKMDNTNTKTNAEWVDIANAEYFALTGRHFIKEVQIHDLLGIGMLGNSSQWTHEATNLDTGDMLFTECVYGGWCTAQWRSMVVSRNLDSTYKARTQMKIPTIRKNATRWALTYEGFEYRQPNGRD